MGTPQVRWRLMHQSLRSRTMPFMRSWPQSGIQRGGVDGLVDVVPESWQQSRTAARWPEDDGVVAAPAVGLWLLDVHLAHR